MKKCNLTNLLKENNEKYYWLGFFLADGCFYNNRIIIGLSKKDLSHILLLKNFLNIENIHETKNSYNIMAMDTKIVSKIIKEFDIKSNKTYIPPNIDSIQDDKLFSLIIGYIDGDGSITKQFKRKDTILRVKCHSSWIFILQKFLIHLYMDCDEKIPKVKINKEGYANFNITNSIVLKTIKNKCIDLKLPILKRKWDNIDLTYVSRIEQIKYNLPKITEMLKNSMKRKDIAIKLGISYYSLTQLLLRRKNK